MLNKQILKSVESLLSQHSENSLVRSTQPVHNNGAVSSFCLVTDRSKYFLKIAKAEYSNLLAAEYTGLRMLQATHCVQTPEIIGFSNQQGDIPAFLLLAWIDAASGGDKNAQRQLGEKLAKLHIGSADIFHMQQFGLDEDNYIGNNPQKNGWVTSWPEFFIERRLKPQIQLGVYHCLIDQSFQQDLLGLCDVIFEQLSSESHTPALLHGDLWGGNILFTKENQPVLIDPAIYFGVPEAELAFTELFGGFTQDFYDSYHTVLPIPYGYQERKQFYNLYHMLNHMNLFGGMFRGQIQTLCKRYIKKDH